MIVNKKIIFGINLLRCAVGKVIKPLKVVQLLYNYFTIFWRHCNVIVYSIYTRCVQLPQLVFAVLKRLPIIDYITCQAVIVIAKIMATPIFITQIFLKCSCSINFTRTIKLGQRIFTPPLCTQCRKVILCTPPLCT